MKEDSLTSKVYYDIRKKILSNQLVGGARLTESTWAKKFDVSRVAVREALMRLSGENLVSFGEKGGCFVKEMTADDLKDIRELREILEIGALRLLFKRLSPDIIVELESICDDFSSMVNRGYYQGACEADVRFHETIIECAGNKRLLELYRNSNIPIFHLKLGNSLLHMDDYVQSDTEHRRIVNGLKENSLDASLEALLQQLDRGEQASIGLI